MADLHEFSAGPVATSIIQFYQKRDAAAPAPMDAAIVGGPCDRAIWYAFRMCATPPADGRAARHQAVEQHTGARLIDDLTVTGVEVHARDPETNGPFVFNDHGGHLQAVMTACAHAVPGGGDQWHVAEFAALGAPTFAKLKEKGVAAVVYGAFDRMQLIMGWSGMTRALFVAENVADSDVFAERVPFDPVYFERLRARAESIIFAAETPPRLHEDPTEDTCRECASHAACHGMRAPAVSCRTCCYSTPEHGGDARWSCCHPSNPRDDLPLDLQRSGCEDHLYLPFLINYAEVVEAGQSGWILYRHHNGRHFVVVSATAMPPADFMTEYDAPAMYHSADLAAAHDHRIIGDGRAVA